jgi:ATP-dependent Clp protease protease subunit
VIKTLDKKIKEEVVESSQGEIDSLWMTLGVDFEARHIQVGMNVDEQMAMIISRALIKMQKDSKDPIRITLSSYGGDVYSGLEIYDSIRESKAPIHIHAMGKIMSAGLLIFLAADSRSASKNTTFMAHSVSTGMEGKLKDLEIDVIETKRLNDKILNILTERTKKPKKLWYRLTLSHNMYFDYDKAVEMGVLKGSKK